MFYIYCIIILLIGGILFYWRKQIKLSRQFLTSVSMQMHYRFHDIDYKYSGNGRAKNGSLVFTTVRNGADIHNVVVKSVKLSYGSFIVHLNNFILITFPNNSDIAHEASLRFRIAQKEGNQIKDNNHFAYIKGYFTTESNGRIPFRIRIPITSV